MGSDNKYLIIGIGGHVVAIEPATGSEMWRTKLKGRDFVTVLPAGGQVYAGAGGEVFCLDAATGQILWNNRLKGLGTGLVAFASSGDAAAVAAIVTQRRAAAAATAASAS